MLFSQRQLVEDETPSASSTPAMESSLCFVYKTRQENEDTHYNDGGKGSCSPESLKPKLIEAQKSIL